MKSGGCLGARYIVESDFSENRTPTSTPTASWAMIHDSVARRGGEPVTINKRWRQQFDEILAFQQTDRRPSSHESKPSLSLSACRKSTPIEVVNRVDQRRLL